jgi:drug/metabolite transporter (DMT)-like permease
MTWLLYSLLTACFESLKDVASKQGLKQLDEYVVAFSSMTIAVLGLLPAVLWDGIPDLKPSFGWALVTGGLLNVVAFTLYIRAIKIADLSLTVPLVTLTPLFMMVTSPLIVHEYPSWADGVGALLLVVGAYVLNIQAQSQGYWAPLKRLVANPGSRLMLIVAMLWSVTSNIDKVGVLSSSPLMWAMSLFGFIALGVLPMVVVRSRHQDRAKQLWLLRTNAKTLALAGGFNALAVGFQMVAVAMVPVTQVIAIKRMSALFSVLLGSLIFREKGLRERALGAAIMVCGVVIINLL